MHPPLVIDGLSVLNPLPLVWTGLRLSLHLPGPENMSRAHKQCVVVSSAVLFLEAEKTLKRKYQATSYTLGKWAIPG